MSTDHNGNEMLIKLDSVMNNIVDVIIWIRYPTIHTVYNQFLLASNDKE